MQDMICLGFMLAVMLEGVQIHKGRRLLEAHGISPTYRL